MKTASPSSIEKLRNEILRPVSRSFFLSIQFLPRKLRDPVALGYLLARTSDTIADTAEVPPPQRREQLHIFADAIQGKKDVDLVAQLRASFMPRQKNEAERALLETLPEILDWLGKIDSADRADVRAVLAKINRGQILDVERFGAASEMRALQTAAELDEYTYLVAGCVGEFWTRLCFRHSKNFADRPENEMNELGINYGKALQLINVTRDAGADLRNGRCYFPLEELAAAGLRADEILRAPEKFISILSRWIEIAQRDLAEGIEYCCAINHWRIRFATALPALIGARTLALLRAAGARSLETKIKIERREVRAIISSLLGRLASRGAIRDLLRRCSGGL